MEIIIIVKKEDVNTSKIGLNFQLKTEQGITIIFHDDALIELIKDYKEQSETDNS